MKSISKFLLSTISMLAVAGNVYAGGLEVSVNDRRIITVAGETESDCVYVKVNNITNSDDSRTGFRYIGKTETKDNGFIFSFLASDAGTYNIFVTDKTGDYTDSSSINIEKPVMTIDGGGIAGKRINVVANLPVAAVGSTGTLGISYSNDELVVGSEPVSATGAEYTLVNDANGVIVLNYKVTGENPKIYFTMNTVEGFSEDDVTVNVTEFALKNRYNDVIECTYDTVKEIELVSTQDFANAIANIVNSVSNLLSPESINTLNYLTVTDDVKSCNELIDAAIAMGVDKESEIPTETLSKLSAVTAKLEEIKPIAEVIYGLIEKETIQEKYDYIKQKKDVFGITELTFERIDALDEEQQTIKEKILRDMFTTKYYTVDDIKKSVGSAAILNLLKITDSEGVQGILDDFEYLVDIDFPALSATVRTIIEKRTFDSVEDVKNAIDAAIKAENNKPSPNPGGGNNSSGGSVSGQISSGGKKHSSSSGSYASVTQNPGQKTDVFTDMNEATWAEEYINKLYEQGIVSGDGNGKFRPNDTLSRAEFVKMLVSAAKLSGNANEMNFDDVKPDNWYYEYVSIAVSNGIVSGISENLFGASGKLTRQDMVVLLYRTLKSDVGGNAEKFVDSGEIADYAIEAVGALSELNVVSGFEDGKFRPYGEATRAMAAKVICVLLEGGLI